MAEAVRVNQSSWAIAAGVVARSDSAEFGGSDVDRQTGPDASGPEGTASGRKVMSDSHSPHASVVCVQGIIECDGALVGEAFDTAGDGVATQ